MAWASLKECTAKECHVAIAAKSPISPRSHIAAGVRQRDNLSLSLDGKLQVQKTIGAHRVKTLTVNIGLEDATEAVIEDVQLFDYALFPEDIAELSTKKSPLEGGQGGVLPGSAGVSPAEEESLTPLSDDGPVLLGDGDGPVVTTTITYYYLNGQRVAQAKDGVFTWIHADHLSSATRITDAAGLEVRRLAYTSFGEEAENQGSGDDPKYKYTGKEHDTTGLYYFGARYYDPALSRFITADTVYDAGPQGLNRYSYALNNPILYRDPTGNLSYADEQDPQVWEDPRPPEERPITIGRNMTKEDVEYRDDIKGYPVKNGRPVLEEYQDASPDERAYHEWLDSDPISRVGVPIPSCSAWCPADPNQMRYHSGLGMGMETFRKQLGYLDAIGEDLDGYTAEELDAIYVKARREEQVMAVALPLGLQAGMALGNIRATKNFDQARQEAFENAGMTDPSKVEFTKHDPETGTVVEFKGQGGAKVGYDAPHNFPGPYHDTQHISWQSAGKRGRGGAQRGNIPYTGPRHPSRSTTK